jgi:DNA-binding TFAR19-related protein (PDSD5 family)
MDYEEMKKRKMEALQKRQLEEEAEAKISSMLRTLLDEKARIRLGNVKLVNKELYLKAVQAILYLQRAGQMQEKLGEEEVKALLEKMNVKREITIKRK